MTQTSFMLKGTAQEDSELTETSSKKQIEPKTTSLVMQNQLVTLA